MRALHYVNLILLIHVVTVFSMIDLLIQVVTSRHNISQDTE